MQWKAFHHPDWSLPVVARRTSEELLFLAAGIGSAILSRGRAETPWWLTSEHAAYTNAISRLRKAGLVAFRRTGGRAPVLELTEDGGSRVPSYCRKRSPWRKKWKGYWYVLSYDVPEKERRYREALRRFLQRMHMGCLQRSVWITHRDIRPEYDDLDKAAGVNTYAHLFEARSVLGREPREIVFQAWDMDRLADAQGRYIDTFTANLHALAKREVGRRDAMRLAREELSAYLAVMQADPLLPMDLWPGIYRGDEVVSLHWTLSDRIARCF
jgi:phenylacetic acid degradation operon negative regulatory protein